LVATSLNAVIDYSLKVQRIFFQRTLSEKLQLKRAMQSIEELRENEPSKNSSINKSDAKKDKFQDENQVKPYLEIGINRENYRKSKVNNSFWENSNIRIKNNEANNEFSNLNNFYQKSVLDESNLNKSKVFKNSSSLSSCSKKSEKSNSFDVINNKAIKIEDNRNFIEKEDREKINIKTIKKLHLKDNSNQKNNRLSHLKKITNNNSINNNSNNNNYYTDNNNNQNIRTSEIMISHDILKQNKK
jgi:hypothetical protein